MMKKLVFLMTLIVGIILSQSLMTNVTFAAAISNQEIPVIIISEDSDFKAKRYTNMINSAFSKKNMTILYSEDYQNKYSNYWIDKNVDTLEEPVPTRTDLINFVSYGNYDKVIYLIVKDVKITAAGKGSNNATYVSVTASAYLVDKQKIIKTSTFTREDSSHRHIDSMKYFAFRKCVRDISKEFSSSL